MTVGEGGGERSIYVCSKIIGVSEDGEVSQYCPSQPDTSTYMYMMLGAVPIPRNHCADWFHGLLQ